MDSLIRDWLALTQVPGLGPKLTEALIEHLGSPGAVRQASPNELQAVPKIGPKLAKDFAEALRNVDVDAELERMDRHGVRAVVRESAEYPDTLKTIYDPPPLLYVRGTLTESDTEAVAIVGSRSCSPYGRRFATTLAADLVQHGFTVVSGLARGIDGEAHRGALQGGGRTLAVLAGGLSRIYPPEHKDLANEVAASGCLISERPMLMEPQPAMFLPRNRLISGLCRATVIVEAGERSGALATARLAAEQDREVFAVPGNVDSEYSQGTLKLLRDGVRMIRGIDDLLEDLRGTAPLVERPTAPTPGSEPPPRPSGPPPGLSEIELAVWNHLDEPRFADELVRLTGHGIGELSLILMRMEGRRCVRKMPGNRYERNS